jgi:hypothetical protein
VLPIILSILLGLLVLLGILLFIPVDLAFAVHKDQRFRASLRIHWLRGAFRKSLYPRRKAPPDAEVGEETAKPGKKIPPDEGAKPTKRKRGPTRWPRYVLAVLRVDGLIAHTLRSVRDLLCHLRLREFFLDLRVGLDDPAATGWFFGALSPVLVPIHALPDSRVHVEPYFDGVFLSGDIRGELRVVPIRILWTVLLFAFSPPSVKVVWALLRERLR